VGDKRKNNAEVLVVEIVCPVPGDRIEAADDNRFRKRVVPLAGLLPYLCPDMPHGLL